MGKLFFAIWIFLGSLFSVHPNSVPLPGVKAIISPTIAPSFPNQDQLPNKLVITRPEDKSDHLSALTVTITDEAKVRKLYEDIYLLPTFVPGGVYNCPSENASKYLLDFYRNTTIIFHG